jgi:hypothetical protein
MSVTSSAENPAVEESDLESRSITAQIMNVGARSVDRKRSLITNLPSSLIVFSDPTISVTTVPSENGSKSRSYKTRWP